MKSFRLISMQVIEEDQLTDIHFKEGLIINKEDETASWLIEVFVEKQFIAHFEEAYNEQKDIVVQVVITKQENDPAAFRTKVKSIRQINDHASVLLKGELTSIKNDYPAMLLEHLLNQGLAGDQLLAEFKDKIAVRPKLVLPKKA